MFFLRIAALAFFAAFAVACSDAVAPPQELGKVVVYEGVKDGPIKPQPPTPKPPAPPAPVRPTIRVIVADEEVFSVDGVCRTSVTVFATQVTRLRGYSVFGAGTSSTAPLDVILQPGDTYTIPVAANVWAEGDRLVGVYVRWSSQRANGSWAQQVDGFDGFWCRAEGGAE